MACVQCQLYSAELKLTQKRHLFDLAPVFASNEPAKASVAMRELEEFSAIDAFQVIDQPWCNLLATVDAHNMLDAHRHRYSMHTHIHTHLSHIFIDQQHNMWTTETPFNDLDGYGGANGKNCDD